ncbi:MAG: hypothetical protein IKZ47_06270 [Clostridia bacterium]|nr:hypothetical protein [Clostridia bacterium]
MSASENFNFDLEKERAARRLLELAGRSKYKSRPPGAKRQKECPAAPMPPPGKNAGILQGLNVPLLGDLFSDPDAALILGILLILYAENSDKLLLLALLYILL